MLSSLRDTFLATPPFCRDLSVPWIAQDARVASGISMKDHGDSKKEKRNRISGAREDDSTPNDTFGLEERAGGNKVGAFGRGANRGPGRRQAHHPSGGGGGGGRGRGRGGGRGGRSGGRGRR
eukprot:COSAG02_NODE_1172_length_14106_cov_77.834725_10_plen_122_part_00